MLEEAGWLNQAYRWFTRPLRESDPDEFETRRAKTRRARTTMKRPRTTPHRARERSYEWLGQSPALVTP